MIQVSIKSVWDALRDIVRHYRNVDLTQYPDELKFLDAGKVGDKWTYFHNDETRNYSRCIAYFKQDDAENWETFDYILLLLQWVAEGKYMCVPSPPNTISPEIFYRRTLVELDEALQDDDFPAQLRVSTPGTYMGQGPRDYIHLKIERKFAGETRWTMD